MGNALLPGLLRVLFPQLNLVSCLVISATDPIICSAIVGATSPFFHTSGFGDTNSPRSMYNIVPWQSLLLE